jgi:hypothetical protein
MKMDALLLMLGDDQWQLMAIHHESVAQEMISNWPQADERAKTQQIQNLQNTLQNWGYEQQPVIIGVPDSWCLCATRQGDGFKPNRQNVLYDFEAQWPVAMEEVVADYLPGKQATLGVCVPLKRLSPVMQALEPLHLNLRAICPKALLALQQQTVGSHNASHQTIWANGQAYHWFTVQDHKPISWQWLPPNEKALVLQAQSLALNGIHDLQVNAIDLPEPLTEQLKALPQVASVVCTNSALDACTIAGASKIATRKTKPWIDLLRYPLVSNTQALAMQRVLSALLLVVIVLGLTVAGTLYIRGMAYQQIAQQNRINQQQRFKELFPDARVSQNISITSRLNSELRAMMEHASVLPAMGTDTSEVSALILLRDAMLGLPVDLPMHVQEIRLENNRIDLRGEATNHADVQKITDALRTSPQLQVDTPQMTQTGAGIIRYTITATYSPAKGAKP